MDTIEIDGDPIVGGLEPPFPVFHIEPGIEELQAIVQGTMNRTRETPMFLISSPRRIVPKA